MAKFTAMKKPFGFFIFAVFILFGFKSANGASVIIDKLSDVKDGWESDCRGYHEVQDFTCGTSTYLIPEADRNDHVGYWTKCSEDQLTFLCHVNFRPTADTWKQLKILAYIVGVNPIELVVQDNTGYHTQFLGGDGWETLTVDLSQYSGIKLIQITPEYSSLNYGVIDQIEVSDALLPTTTTVRTTAASTSPTTVSAAPTTVTSGPTTARTTVTAAPTTTPTSAKP